MARLFAGTVAGAEKTISALVVLVDHGYVITNYDAGGCQSGQALPKH
jgi:hypothetical protein